MITIAKKAFLDGISGAANIAKNSLAFEDIRIQQDGDVLSFTATNGERSLTKSITVTPSIEPIDVLVPSKIEQLVKDFSADVVNFDFGDNKVKITTAKNKAELKTKTTEKFPAFPTVPEDATKVTMFLSDLQSAFKSVIYATASDAVRFAFRGVNMIVDSDTGEIEFCATDSHLLANYVVKCAVTGNKRSIIVPPQTVQMIAGFEGVDKQEITLLFDGSKLYIETAKTKAHSSLIDAKFPDYKRVIPTSSTISATIDASDFVAGIKQCGSFIDKSSGRTVFTFEGGNVRISATDPELGGIDTEVALVAPVTTSIQVALNVHYILAICGALGSKTVTLEMTENTKAIKVLVGDNTSFLAVIMPLVTMEEQKSA